MKKSLLILLLLVVFKSQSQSLYFPPLTGNDWDTISPARLGWCQSNIDSLYTYLEAHGTDAFVVLKNGKIVLEKYFGNYTQDSIHYWASAGKSLIGFMTGMAQEQGQVNISNTVSSYIGAGWTVAPTDKESKISIRNLLTMTSGLDDYPTPPCTNESTTPGCLEYKVDTGIRWAYHTGAYQQIAKVLSTVSGTNINTYTANMVGNRIGMTGLWYDGTFYSKARSMARFGLLALNKGVWNTDTLLKDKAYYNQMVNTSQPYNPAYGYLWWLNGKTSFLSPGLQFAFPGSLIPKAPDDMVAALGKNDQKIYVVPSQQLVIIRTGESAYGVALAFSPFDDELWGKIDSLSIGCNYIFTGNGNWSNAANWTNNSIPPSSLQQGATITLNPISGGECVLDVQQTINAGTNLIIPGNTKFRITKSLNILQH